MPRRNGKARRKKKGRAAKTFTCRSSGKVAFMSEVAALAKAALAEEWYGDTMGVYRCPDCRKWHTTREKSNA